MTNFRDLPPEIRLMVYGHAFRNQMVKFVRNLQQVRIAANSVTLKRASCANLLISTKATYNESRPLFFQLVRVDVTATVDRMTGAIQSAEDGLPSDSIKANLIDPMLLHHVKIKQDILSSSGGKTFAKLLKNLRSFTYDCNSHFYVWNEMIEDYEDHLDICRDCRCCEETYYENQFLRRIINVMLDEHYKITGKCCDPDSECYAQGMDDCLGEEPIRSFIGSWAWRDQPFELIAEAEFAGEPEPINVVGLVLNE
jgi:hypothetical protein